MKRNLLLPMMLLLAGGVFGPSVKAQNWSGTAVEDATKSETVYLWNVGAQQFLGKGGRWGTQAVLSNVGTPFKVVKGTDAKGTDANGNEISISHTYLTSNTYCLESVVKGEGSASGCLEFMNADGATSKADTLTYFVDRGVGDRSTLAFTFSGDKTAYQLEITSSAGPTICQGDFYLFAKGTNAEAKGNKEVSDGDKAYSQWIIVTEDERQEIFKKAEASSSSAVPATFLMFDNGFDRKDNNVTNWQTSSASGKGLDGELSWANNSKLDKKGDFLKPSDACPSTVTTTTYTYTYTGSHTYGRNNTHTVTHKVTTTTPPTEQPKTLTVTCNGWNNSSYHTPQTVTVTLDEDATTSTSETKTYAGYTYYNGNGYEEDKKTTVDEDGNKLGKEEIYEQKLYGGDWTANIHGSYGVVNQSIDNAIREGWYKVSCVGFTTATQGTAQLYVSSGTGNDATTKYFAVEDLVKLSADKAPATYVKASKLINGGGYEASAMVYIDKNAGKLKQLSFGIMVDGAESTAWTCFDDFQIDYLGMPNTVLVLDEDQTDVEYINKQTTPENQTNEKRTLYLHRTVNANKWNSIVLPVSLTVSQVQSAFGDNFKLSKFEGATNPDIPGRMYFKAVNINRNDKNAVAIEAGQLYIFKPEKEEPTGQKEVEFPKATEITDKLTSYFTFIGVTFNDGRKDFESKVEGDKGKETYDNGQVQFVGTYVADKDYKQIPANSYVLKGNKGDEAGLWFYRTVPTSTKGFRGWLQTDPTNASKISFSINGVVSDDEATGIDAIDAELNGNAVNGNVYNLSGQLVRRNATSLEGLAKGVYIHNGKKFIVK